MSPLGEREERESDLYGQNILKFHLASGITSLSWYRLSCSAYKLVRCYEKIQNCVRELKEKCNSFTTLPQWLQNDLRKTEEVLAQKNALRISRWSAKQLPN